MKSVVLGVAGRTLEPHERELLARYPPAGIILFARNVADPGQLAALIAALRAVLPAESVLMVDQEGGRVARLRPPHWPAHPASGVIGALYGTDAAAGLRAAFLTGALIGGEMAASGFDVVCAPVLDRRLPGATAAIGDRAFSADPEAVARLGAAVADGLMAAGMQPVMKHLPGHGRAGVDSHEGLPVVGEQALAEEADLLPFRLNAGLPWAMTAHILYPAWDKALPATLSPAIIEGVIRQRIGFGGVLVSDDLAMNALSGEPAARALAALDAGCDLALYCAGDPAANAAILAAAPVLPPRTAERIRAARAAAASRRLPLDPASLRNERDRLLG